MSEKIYTDKKWVAILKDEFQKDYIINLKKFLDEEKKSGHIIYPPRKLIFNAFSQTPYDRVKVVIVGQDPYHGEGQAHGLSFSVPDKVAPPPSLKNIFKELVEDVKINEPKTGNLSYWAKQGVFLLNATLSVRANCPRSHYGKGWELFTDKIIELLAKRDDPLVFILWGKSAQEKLFNVFKNCNKKNHLILTSAHPSFYSAHNFFGCKHFSKTNKFLILNNKESIDWQIP
jgi:uracil-DNA glycosylase